MVKLTLQDRNLNQRPTKLTRLHYKHAIIIYGLHKIIDFCVERISRLYV